MFRGGSNGRVSRGGTWCGGASRGRGRGAPRSTQPRGVFADGIWHCDCKPRLPAEHFKVKKEGKNQGRWFYTCQQTEPNRCGFFLWDEDAKIREEGAVLNNSRTEPQARRVRAQDGWDAGRSRHGRTELGQRGGGGMFSNMNPRGESVSTATMKGDDSSTEDEGSTPPPYSSQTRDAGRLKRTAGAADLAKDDDDECFDWPLTGQEENELANAAEAAAPPETPRKALKTGVYATPTATTEKKRRLPWLEEPAAALTTPETSRVPAQQQDYFATPSKPPAKALPTITEQNGPKTPNLPPPTPATAAKSPSPPSKHKDALSNPADSSSSLTSEALATLSAVKVPPEALSKLRSVLSKHDLKTQGISKGRDISRLALKARDAKLAELQAKIQSLEAEREVDKSVIRTLRWEQEEGGKAGV